MNKYCIPLWWLVWASTLAASAQAAPHPITKDEVADALHLDSSVSISMPDVVSRETYPKLRILAEEHRSRSARLRLGCASGNACLPFYVGLEFGRQQQAEDFFESTRATSRTPARGISRPVVPAGSSVRLELQVREVRIEIYVRCLQPGAEGDVIRARDETTKKVYRARVVDKFHLRAEL